MAILAKLHCALSLSLMQILLPAFGAQTAPGREAAATPSPAVAQTCVPCHGRSGEGQPAGGFPRLAAQARQYLVKQLKDFRSGRRQSAVMEPIAKALDDNAMEAVSAFYHGIAASPQPAQGSAKPPPAVGAQLALHGNWDKEVPACFSCHGAGGTGIAPHFPAIAHQNAAYTAAQLRAWKWGARANDPQGLMKAVADRLSDAEIDAVAAYLESIRLPGK